VRVFVTGASGLLGEAFCEQLAGRGDEVIAISRKRHGGSSRALRWIAGDVGFAGPWQSEIDGSDAVVHLAGEPIASRRWNEAHKRRLVASRVDSTRHVARAIAQASCPPRVLVSASATGYYGPRGEERLSEDAPPGDDFLARLCRDWESAALRAASEKTRVVCIRYGVVLSARGGALERMLPPFRLGLGGPVGPKQHWFPWIHERDAAGLIRHVLDHAGLSGALNGVAPGTVRMAEFASALGRLLGRPAVFPLPLGLLRLPLGEFADFLSPGQRVDSGRAVAEGFQFEFAELKAALDACLA